MNAKPTKVLLIIMVITLILTACSPNTTPKVTATEPAVTEPAVTDYWPDASWRTSTPEAQGMDSETLYKMIDYVNRGKKKIHSIMIIRNGYQVLDANFFPYRSDLVHITNSCTKSVTSTLIGMAINEGKIKSVNENVLDLFPDVKMQNLDDTKKKLNIAHLLTMTPGLQWRENGSYDSSDSWMQMRQSDDPIQYFLDKPMQSEPGERFYYNTGASHVLSAILGKAIGENPSQYAEKKLFQPLGISNVFWENDAKGLSLGGSGLFMSPSDMARFGYLYIRNGNWKGQQIVPEDWAADATRKHIETPAGLAGRDGYGYQWWMNPFGGYSARGYGGQYIFVLPEQDLVVVFTASLMGADYFLPESMVQSFVLPAVKADEALSENQKAHQELQKILQTMASPPAPNEMSNLPETAKAISGRTIQLDYGEALQLTFIEENGTWRAEFRHGTSNPFQVGLQGVHLVSDAGQYWPLPDHNMVAALGGWEDENVFSFEVIPLHEMDILTYRLSFSGEDVAAELRSRLGGVIMSANGKLGPKQ